MCVELLAVGLLRFRTFKRRHQAEIYVHRLIGFGLCPAGDVGEQGPESGLGRRCGQQAALCLGRRKSGRQQTHGGAFDIAFATGDLTGEPNVGQGFQTQFAVQ